MKVAPFMIEVTDREAANSLIRKGVTVEGVLSRVRKYTVGKRRPGASRFFEAPETKVAAEPTAMEITPAEPAQEEAQEGPTPAEGTASPKETAVEDLPTSRTKRISGARARTPAGVTKRGRPPVSGGTPVT